ncbi:MAG: insulinase family protein [Proteobacteria bacterium]|nr:insulinase family protein [Pseudomonadota bacterium]MCP4918139.1 insulinase family protein [Pseudomonadota bacterium]
MFALMCGIASAGVLPVDVQTEHLDNGLTVYLAPMDTPGVVSWQVWMDVGTRNETSRTRGLAHLNMYLAAMGSTSMDSDERERQILQTGATDTAISWQDQTVYSLSVPAEHLPSVIMIEANRLMYMDYDEADLEQVAGAVQGSFNRQQASAEMAISSQYQSTAYRVHPYGHTTMGYQKDIESFDSRYTEVRAFYNTWYRPENARIVVVGDFDPQAILTQLNLTFGVWEGGDSTSKPAVEPAQTEPRRTDMVWEKGPANPQVMVGWRVPGFDARDPDAATIAVIEELIASEVGSLHQDLVLERALVYEIEAINELFVDERHFTVRLEVKHPDDVALVEEAVHTAIADLAEGVDPEQLELLRDSALARFRLSQDSPEAVGQTIGEYTFGGADASAVEAFYRNFAQVSADDVSRVVQEHFVPEGMTVATLRVPEEK